MPFARVGFILSHSRDSFLKITARRVCGCRGKSTLNDDAGSIILGISIEFFVGFINDVTPS